jgi:hypothetical protein
MKMMKKKFKEHFGVNGGIFKTSEEEIEAYVELENEEHAIKFAEYIMERVNNEGYSFFSDKYKLEIYNKFKVENYGGNSKDSI